MRQIDYLRYDEVDYVWIANYYDMPLSGLCRYKCELAWFELAWENQACEYYRIFHLTRREKFRNWLRKRAFEICVGRHWTYPDRKLGVRFDNSRWWRNVLFKCYYGVQRRYRRH